MRRYFLVWTMLLLAGLHRASAQVYDWTTIAGMVGTTNSTDGVGSAARFNHPYSLAVDASGNVFVADTFNQLIRKLSPAGVNWTSSTIGSGSFSQGITVAPDGSVYLTDSASRVRRLTLAGSNWVMTTVAGGGYGSADGTNGAAQFAGPEGIAVDSSGNTYVADTQNHTIRKVSPVGANWVVTTIAGSAGKQGTNDGVGAGSRFNWPTGIAVDGGGNLFVADNQNHTIRKLAIVSGNWVATTIAGLAGSLGSVDGMNGSARFYFPSGIVVKTNGIVFVADTINSTIRKLTAVGNNWVVSTVGGLASNPGSANGTNISARFQYPYGITVDTGGNIYVADTYNETLRLGLPLPTGSLQVVISPSGAVSVGAQWQVDSGPLQNNGATISGLAVGSHTVTFKTVNGWTTPTSQATTINANQTTTITGTYTQQFGFLQVTLTPAEAVSAGAQWQVDGGAW